MNSIFSYKTLELGIHFYKKFFLASLFITVFLVVSKVPFSAIMGLKLMLFGLLFLSYLVPKSRQQLIYYKNFGISKLSLFGISFFIDAMLTLVLVLLIKLF